MLKPVEGTILAKIADIKIRDHREDLGDILGLSSSIRNHGLINPIVIDNENNLIAGYRRLKAAELLKWEEIEARLYEDLTPIERRKIELEENIVHKKAVTWQEEIKLKKELHELYMREHADTKVGMREERPWSQRKTADLLGVSRALLSEELKLAALLEQYPELAKTGTKSDAIRKMYRLRELALLQEIARRHGTSILTKDIELIKGDCLEVLKTFEDSSFDLCITDPPWGINLTELAGAKAIDYKVFDDFQTKAISIYERVVPEIFRVLKNGSHFYLFFGFQHYERVVKIVKNAGFDVREVPCVWIKDKPGYTDWEFKPMPQYESFLFAAKNIDNSARRLKEATSDVFQYKRSEGTESRIHLTEKPVELLKRLITLSSNEGERIIDPFAGSASTLIAAMLLKRKAIGIELDQSTYDIALGRLRSIIIEELANE